MELGEIFRYEERKLYPEVQSVHGRYVQLKRRFEAFVRFFPPDDRDFFPEGVEFRPEPDRPRLVVLFCGREFRFCFEMVDRQGLVQCFLKSQNDRDDQDPRELGRFTFNGEGITDIVPPGERGADPIAIHQGRAAYGIVASFLVAPF